MDRNVLYGRTLGGDLAENSTNQHDILRVRTVEVPMTSQSLTLGVGWQLALSPSGTIREIQVLNPTVVGATFSMAITSSPTGIPIASSAWLAWGSPLGVNSVWRWQGLQPLETAYLHVYGSVAGLVLQVSVVET